MTNESYSYLQNDLIDLKIKQARIELELNFSIMSFENMQKKEFSCDKFKSSAFLQAYFLLKKNGLFQFVEKANSSNIGQISCKFKDEKVAYFLKTIDSVIKLDEEELVNENKKIRRNIRKMEEAIEELDYMMLKALPKNNYSS
ncbi:MAG: hypothetical protein PUG67_04320 [Peptoniphilaceae bacterium]|nr:hypothetical protein [Peptoniphilaceae bacterium]MDY6019087.1 hypothetical protein [Anaerococcus sp.]